MKISICIGSSCHLKGSRRVVEQLQQLVAQYDLTEKVELSGTLCLGNCMQGVNVNIDGVPFSVTPDTVSEFFQNEVLSRLGM